MSTSSGTSLLRLGVLSRSSLRGILEVPGGQIFSPLMPYHQHGGSYQAIAGTVRRANSAAKPPSSDPLLSAMKPVTPTPPTGEKR